MDFLREYREGKTFYQLLTGLFTVAFGQATHLMVRRGT
jgi:hypothetical protein